MVEQLTHYGTVLEQEPLSRHTTLRVGGCARYLIYPKDVESIQGIIDFCCEHSMKFKVIGRGSNLLASDQNFLGVVLKLDRSFNHIQFEGNEVTVASGYSMMRLAKEVVKRGFTGFEWASGVPGNIGGGVYMNAGAYGRDISHNLLRVQVINRDGQLFWLDNHECQFSYRTSIFQTRKDLVVLQAVFSFEIGNIEKSIQQMDSWREYRQSTQPLQLPNCGSIFRNPPNQSAGKMIEDLGLKGKRIGGAQVSEKHANFIVNVDQATAQDIADLIAYVQKAIQDHYHIELHQEVEYFNW
ncbi:MAG: UDP-N-acetylmuramate dehydrogenase [Culicoidibacterales bacterium]